MKTHRMDIIAGPNGCGKSTIAELLLRQQKIENFINADVIARGLNATTTAPVSIDAGRLMLTMVHEGIANKDTFAFETTLSGLSWKRVIQHAREVGLEVNIYFVLVDSVETAVQRVRERVRSGGHSVPEATIRRRYDRSLTMFNTCYRLLADKWWVFDNSGQEAEIVARKTNGSSHSSERYQRLFGKFI